MNGQLIVKGGLAIFLAAIPLAVALAREWLPLAPISIAMIAGLIVGSHLVARRAASRRIAHALAAIYVGWLLLVQLCLMTGLTRADVKAVGVSLLVWLGCGVVGGAVAELIQHHRAKEKVLQKDERA